MPVNRYVHNINAMYKNMSATTHVCWKAGRQMPAWQLLRTSTAWCQVFSQNSRLTFPQNTIGTVHKGYCDIVLAGTGPVSCTGGDDDGFPLFISTWKVRKWSPWVRTLTKLVSKLCLLCTKTKMPWLECLHINLPYLLHHTASKIK